MKRKARAKNIAVAGALIATFFGSQQVAAQQPAPACSGSGPSGPGCNVYVGVSFDSIATVGFSANTPVTFEVFESAGGPQRLGPITRQSDASGYATINRPTDHDIDIVAGNHVVVTDVATSTVKKLDVSPLTVDAVDIENDTVSGTSIAADRVNVDLDRPLVHGETVTDNAGVWTVDFGALGADITKLTRFNSASVPDGDGDVTVALPEACRVPIVNPAGNCVVNASLEDDYMVGHGTPNSELVFEVFDSPGGQSLFGPVSRTTDRYGLQDANDPINFGVIPGPDLVPGTYIEMTDVATGKIKTLELAPLSIERFDPATDVVEGLAPPGASVEVVAMIENFPPQMVKPSVEVVTASGGTWTADFKTIGYDIGSSDWAAAQIPDDDGDHTGDTLGAPIPGCIDDSDTTCGSAGPDTIREDDGEVIAGGENDTTLIGAEEVSDAIDVDLGTGDDGAVIDPSKRHRFLTSLMSSVAALLPVVVDGGDGSDLVILPTHVADLIVKVRGGSGNDVVELQPLGGGKLPIRGRYTLVGGGGNDKLTGADGDDILEGGGGTDVLRGGEGFDICYATGNDQTFSCEKVVNKRHR